MISVPKVIAVPSHGREAGVAIRLLAARGRFGSITIPRTSWIGTEGAIELQRVTWQSARLRAILPQLLISASLLLSSVLFLLLPLWRSDAPEYFWFGLWLLFANGYRVFSSYPDVVGMDGSLAATWCLTLVTLGSWVGWHGLMRSLFLGRTRRTVWLAATAYGALSLGISAFITTGGQYFPLLSVWNNLAANGLMAFAYYQFGWRANGEPIRMLTVHVAILAYLVANFIGIGSRSFGVADAIYLQETLARTITLLLFTFAITILMNQRSARLLRERQRLSGELASAAEVQSLLLTSLPSAGDLYRVEPVYLPASEVGGDFYQVLERPHGTRVVLLGDVSGKGLKAAMLVSATVGMLRVISSSGPAKILAALNDGLCGRTGGGFVTCCCARFDPIANAGHPAPYCDGLEVELDSGLPLGLAPEVQYAESLSRGERYTLVSDGVVEAENPNRELLGFDRTRAISGQSAQKIAETAQAWGQNDAITVVTIERTKC